MGGTDDVNLHFNGPLMRNRRRTEKEAAGSGRDEKDHISTDFSSFSFTQAVAG